MIYFSQLYPECGLVSVVLCNKVSGFVCLILSRTRQMFYSQVNTENILVVKKPNMSIFEKKFVISKLSVKAQPKNTVYMSWTRSVAVASGS